MTFLNCNCWCCLTWLSLLVLLLSNISSLKSRRWQCEGLNSFWLQQILSSYSWTLPYKPWLFGNYILQVGRYNETVQENMRQGNIIVPPPNSEPVTTCEGSFSTTEFIFFVIGAFILGILLTSFVIMWMINLRRITEKEEGQEDPDEENEAKHNGAEELN